VRQILVNKCDPLPITLEHKKKKRNHNTQTQKHRWTRFTYDGKETRFITKLFKDTNITVAFTMNNTIGMRLTMEHKTQCKCDKSGVYQLTCPDCKMTYTGQTGRPFKTRFKEQMRDFKYNNRKSKFAQHLLDNGHAIGNMKEIMKIIHVTRKGRMLNTLESFHIYKETKAENQINDKLTAKGNEIFEAALKHDP